MSEDERSVVLPPEEPESTVSSAHPKRKPFPKPSKAGYAFAGTLLVGVLGGVIGSYSFINFFVSFSLAFYVAVKSRGLTLKDLPAFLSTLGKYFTRHPGAFF